MVLYPFPYKPGSGYPPWVDKGIVTAVCDVLFQCADELVEMYEHSIVAGNLY